MTVELEKNTFLWSIDECFLCPTKLTKDVEWVERKTKKGIFAICMNCCIDISEVI